MDWKSVVELARQAKEALLRDIDESNESAADKKALKALFSSLSPMDILHLGAPGVTRETISSVKKDEKIDFRPVYTRRSAIRKLQFGDSGLKALNSSTIHYVWKQRPGIYLNIYFLRSSRDAFHVCCYFGDLFNYIYGRDVRNTKGDERVPKAMAKRFPYICSILRNMVIDDSMGGEASQPYLNTIAFGGATSRQWFLAVRVNDISEFADFSLRGPQSEFMQNVINALSQASARIISDIAHSHDDQLADKYNGFTDSVLLR